MFRASMFLNYIVSYLYVGYIASKIICSKEPSMFRARMFLNYIASYLTSVI